MDRKRVTGAVVLMLAAVMLLAGRQLLDPGLVGLPAAAPFPPPPPVGACLVSDASGLRTVDCTMTHNAEITYSWAALDRLRIPEAAEVTCRQVASRYAGVAEVAGWLTSATVDSRLLEAPPGARAGNTGWSACVVAPAGAERYDGSIRGSAARSSRPAAYALCFRTATDRTAVSCSTPHAAESLGLRHGPLPVRTSRLTSMESRELPVGLTAELTSSCRTLAATMTGVADPTYDGALAVQVAGGTAREDLQVSGREYWADCRVVSTGDRALIASVVGRGDAPVPFG